ncbi:hypothetical protein [Nesterenkonia aerolata]|uniref:Uncharacterized protein n=1 Tax=Nesterenkonia aerolata TaxID=3074079 RepID=A0ABU2DP37_9MICC|nr:hypothetical protein [Nesterenkonia sp. LY-0111]MDR8018203.1 hypothetical protein [Nesterenkonia sp. LY-0111]
MSARDRVADTLYQALEKLMAAEMDHRTRKGFEAPLSHESAIRYARAFAHIARAHPDTHDT